MTATTAGIHPSLTIAQVSERTGLTKDTLRWYESEGLIPRVDRDHSGYRAYDESAVRMIELVVCLRRTGMPVREMRDFVSMVAEGAASHGRRMTLLGEHRRRVLAQVAQLQEDLGSIDDKVDHYARLIDLGLDCAETPVTDPTIRTLQRSHV